MHVGEVRRAIRLNRVVALIAAARVRRGCVHRATEERDHLGQGAQADDLDPVDQRRLGGVRAGDDHPVQPPRGRGDRHRQRTGRGHEGAVERELAPDGVPFETDIRKLAVRGQHPHREREIETGTLLADARGREVDDHATGRPLEPRALHGRADPFARVADRRSRHPREGERRQAAPDRGLHHDDLAPYTGDHDAKHPRVHARTLRVHTDSTVRSERVGEEQHVGVTRVREANAGHVEPDVGRPRRELRQEHLREPSQPPSLREGDRLVPLAEGRPGAGLHLADHEQPAAPQDEVDLPRRATPVARDEREPRSTVGRERGVLAATPDPNAPVAGAERRCSGGGSVEIRGGHARSLGGASDTSVRYASGPILHRSSQASGSKLGTSTPAAATAARKSETVAIGASQWPAA